MPQMYAEFAKCNWDIKVGKFVTLLEYEVIAAPGNFFYSHSYGFLYAVPFTQTGIQVTRKVNDQLTWSAGINRGWDQFDDFLDDDRIAFMGGLYFQTKDSKKKFASVMNTG